MKINPAPLHLAQTVLTALIIVFSVAILGTSAHTLDVFNKQQSSNPWWLPLWSQHFDVHGTKALVASSVITLVLSSAFLISTFVPSLNLKQKHTLRAAISLATILPSLLLTLISTVWGHILNRQTPDIDTIQTWTCKYQHSSPLRQDLSLPSNMGNSNFGSLCRESRFALYGTLIAFLLLGFSMVLSFLCWGADKWDARQKRKNGEVGEEGSVAELSYVPKAYEP
jgi:amino acid transporter